MSVSVQEQSFDIGLETTRFSALAAQHGVGAIASFVGLVRDYRDDSTGQHTALRAMRLEHYPGMTERILNTLVNTATQRFGLSAVRLIHRYGLLNPTEPIVLVLTASAHRAEAFRGCNFLMDRLKTDAPFWKCEQGTDGSQHWVEAKAADNASAQKWVLD